jgi:MarR family transcriptional repressor of emrRAB
MVATVLPPVPGPHYSALLQLLRTAETLWNASRVFFARWELSPSQFNLLNLLYETASPLTQSALSRQLIMHRSNVTGLVDRLEQRTLVQREASAADRRTWQVSLTPQGRRLVEQIRPAFFQLAEEVWTGLPEGRASQLTSDLSVISNNAQRLADHLEGTPV